MKAKRNKLRAKGPGRDHRPGTRHQGQGQLSFSARINVGTWLFPMSSRAARCLLLLPGEYRKPIIIQTRHLHFIIMNEGWRTQNNGQLVRWSTGQLVCLAEPLNYVTLGKFMNFLCRANRFAVISLSVSIITDPPVDMWGVWPICMATDTRQRGETQYQGELCKI